MVKRARYSVLVALLAVLMVGLTSCNGGKVGKQATPAAETVTETAGMTAEEQGAYDRVFAMIIKARDEHASRLIINEKHLSRLPEDIGALTELAGLFIGDTNISTLPPEIGKLAALESLLINNSPLKALPREIGQLGRLDTLMVSNCQLLSLPPEIGNLSNLRHMILDENKICSLPRQIIQLTKLNSIDLRENQFKTLPSWITEMNMDIACQVRSHPQLINLHGNPLEEPPIEIVKQGNAAIKQYFEDKGEEKSEN
ncbi:MAG: leucine-rich repeat domain-containing protein [Phycisphaerae bacterium]|nr:leucine-rich repeat domain-containing protein [Phycisphaerae bacterium]